MHELFISRATILFRYLVTYFNPKEKKIKEKISTKYSASSSLPFRLCLLSHFLLPNPTIVRTLALRKKLPPSSEAWVYLVFIEQTLALPWWLSGKESACQCRRRGFNPWAGEIPWRREWLPTPVFLSGESQGQRDVVTYSPQGHKRVGHDLATKQQQCKHFNSHWKGPLDICQ